MPFRYRIIFLLVICASCSQQTENSSTHLYGRWVLDSTSGRGGKIISGGPREHTEFTLRRNGTFDYLWRDFDVMGEYGGTYSYKKSPGLVPAILILSATYANNKEPVAFKDTMIVLSITDSLLKTQERESYTTPDSNLIMQNRINVYRKKKSN